MGTLLTLYESLLLKEITSFRNISMKALALAIFVSHEVTIDNLRFREVLFSQWMTFSGRGHERRNGDTQERISLKPPTTSRRGGVQWLLVSGPRPTLSSGVYSYVMCCLPTVSAFSILLTCIDCCFHLSVCSSTSLPWAIGCATGYSVICDTQMKW